MLQKLLTYLNHLAIIWTPKIVVGILIVIVFWGIGLTIQKLTFGIEKRAKSRQEAINLIGQIVKYSIIVIGIITALGSMHVNVSALVASLGLTGFALSFALKDILSNIVAGFIIILYQPFKVGHHVTITGFEGDVTKINLRYTHLENESSKYLVPNSIVLTNTVKITTDKV